MKSMIKVKRISEVELRLSEENETADENPAGPQGYWLASRPSRICSLRPSVLQRWA